MQDGTARTCPRHQPPGPRRRRGGSSLTLLVLACNEEDTAGIDLASGALVRARVPWPSGHRPDLAPFDVVETVLADRPERDDLAQPEAVSAHGLPRHLGTLHGRRVRQLLHPLAAPMEEHVLGFPGCRRPIGNSAAFAPHWPCSYPRRARCSFDGTATGRCGSGSVGDEATTGCPWRISAPSGHWTRPDGTGCRGRTSLRRSDSSLTIWSHR